MEGNHLQRTIIRAVDVEKTHDSAKTRITPQILFEVFTKLHNILHTFHTWHLFSVILYAHTKHLNTHRMRCDKVTWHACAKHQSSIRDKGTSHWYVTTDNGLNLLKLCERIRGQGKRKDVEWAEPSNTRSKFGFWTHASARDWSDNMKARGHSEDGRIILKWFWKMGWPKIVDQWCTRVDMGHRS